ncbi:MAG: alpha/beta hydrolase, partial [Solirubrobacteraceae bacterium]
MNLILTPLLFFTIIFTSFTSKNIELTHSTNRNNDTINQEYIHKKCYSLASRLTKFGIGIVSKNRREKIIATLSKNSKNTESVMNIPKWISKKYTLKISLIDGKKVAIISPKKVVKKDKVVIYLHGGAYISNISFGHWWLIDSLCEKSGYTFIIPDYPLAPIIKSVDV